MSESKNFDPKSLDDLLAKVAAATGPDRRLDVMIGVVTDLRIEGMTHPFRQYVDIMGVDDAADHAERHQSILRTELPRYTASLDAALSLLKTVQPGWSLQLHAHPGASYATLYRLGEIFHTDGRIQRNVTSPYFEGIRIQDEHAALAICEAILSSLKAST